MCHHHFEFPEDTPENYNLDGKTLTGRCKCGATQKAYGMRWAIQRHEDILNFSLNPYGELRLDFIDKQTGVC